MSMQGGFQKGDDVQPIQVVGSDDSARAESLKAYEADLKKLLEKKPKIEAEILALQEKLVLEQQGYASAIAAKEKEINKLAAEFDSLTREIEAKWLVLNDSDSEIQRQKAVLDSREKTIFDNLAKLKDDQQKVSDREVFVANARNEIDSKLASANEKLVEAERINSEAAATLKAVKDEQVSLGIQKKDILGFSEQLEQKKKEILDEQEKLEMLRLDTEAKRKAADEFVKREAAIKAKEAELELRDQQLVAQAQELKSLDEQMTIKREGLIKLENNLGRREKEIALLESQKANEIKGEQNG